MGYYMTMNLKIKHGQVTGGFQSVQDALFHIAGRIRETFFPLKPHPSISSNPYFSSGPDVPPTLMRSRNEPESPVPIFSNLVFFLKAGSLLVNFMMSTPAD